MSIPRSASLLLSAIAGLGLASGCTDRTDPMADDDGSASDTESSASASASGQDTDSATTDDPDAGSVELGWGIDSFTPLVDGGEFQIVWGTQGAAMFPMPVRVANIPLPDDPSDFLDPRAPMMNLELDIEGHNDGFGGHFKRIANYAMTFDALGDGTYEFLYVAILVPDDKDPLELDGLPAHLRVEVIPFESDSIVREFDLTVTVEDPPV
jgi:hypothetical protein